MQLSKRDVLATCLVLVAGIVWLMRAVGAPLPGSSSARAAGFVVLALGFVASATAVVPTFLELLHGNRLYLALTSTLGLVALIAAVTALLAESGVALGVVVGVMVLLWVIATIHHTMLDASRQTAAHEPIRHEQHRTAAHH
ncbi:MAG: hypothetical protein AB7Q42_07705 [Acidimicrobiia bacterium]